MQSTTVTPESILAYYGINTRSNRFSKEQLGELTSCFEENPYPTSTKKQELSEKTGLTIGQIENWLWKKRGKMKKMIQQDQSWNNITPCTTTPICFIVEKKKNKHLIEYFLFFVSFLPTLLLHHIPFYPLQPLIDNYPISLIGSRVHLLWNISRAVKRSHIIFSWGCGRESFSQVQVV